MKNIHRLKPPRAEALEQGNACYREPHRRHVVFLCQSMAARAWILNRRRLMRLLITGNKMKISALLFFAVINCQAQLFQFENIPVEINRATMPWAGGLNAVQINTFDIDMDGVEDIIAFEKMTNQILPFLAKNNQYQFAPEYAPLFPDDISGWMLLRDFNRDGKKDIFTSDPFGARVFVNTSDKAVTWRK